ncbi:MAG: PP2C family protein-serine/threonine phosphatase [Acidobacteriota bacterium]
MIDIIEKGDGNGYGYQCHVIQLCLDHLTPSQQRALEEDLELASQIQRGLLPKKDFQYSGWEVAYYYEPSGFVSGDYCDLVTSDDEALYFILGDVSGKGVAASMLMVHLHAMFRSLISVGLPLHQLMERASRVFCESTLPTQYATLVCGRAEGSGQVEICNAGHLPPLLIQNGNVSDVKAAGLPVGIFCDQQFSPIKLQLAEGDTILLFSDGLTEVQNSSGTEYGRERLAKLVDKNQALPPEKLVAICLGDLRTFRGQATAKDDLTIMAIRQL